MAGKRSFGGLRKLPSGRWQANYTGPDVVVHKAPATFAAKVDAEGWLAAERRKIDLGTWRPPTVEQKRTLTLAEYAAQRIGQRTLTPRTRKHYENILDRHIGPVLGGAALAGVTVTMVRSWYAALLPDAPTARAHAYALLHSVFRDALDEGLIDANPARERKAMNSKRVRPIRALTKAQLVALVEHVRADDLKVAVMVGGWCGLRSGELKGLRRRDVADDASVIHVERAVTYRGGEYFEGEPKTEAGVRTVSVPSSIRPAIVAHMRTVGKGRDALVFTGTGGPEGYLTDWQLRRAVASAGAAIGVDDLRPHELRHTAATLAAQTGATTKQLMARIGHATMGAALLYQHAAAEQDAEIARKLDEM